MTQSSKRYIGLDVHKGSIDIAIAEAGADGEVRHFGTIPGDLLDLDKALQRIRRTGGPIQVVYEAGPCGFEVYRHLFNLGIDCIVVAPSMIPKHSGDRIKTDRRESIQLARLHRAGELAPIHVPRSTPLPEMRSCE